MSDNPELSAHIMHGLAYTVGSALGCTPPTAETCLQAFLVANKAGLTAGSRAWSKHAHRSRGEMASQDLAKTLEQGASGAANDLEQRAKRLRAEEESAGWWGKPSGPVAKINENSLLLFSKVMNDASWRNLHWLPHQVLVYEIRVPAGFGMRWSQDRSPNGGTESEGRGMDTKEKPWMFRGFLEPQMDNGHEVGWRH
ncbi:hypothetical protein HWV62_16816 [Athelia sp. TMB]|nr:hypothetical protein HWV62_16816 [Athelia sp. TMB]